MRNPIPLNSGLRRALLLVVAAIATLAGRTRIAIGEARPPSSQAAELQEPQTTPAAIPAVAPEYRVGQITVTGAKVLKNEFIQGALGVPGEVFSESRFRQGLEDLKKLYGQLGFVYFAAKPVLDLDEQKKLVNLAVSVDEGRQYLVNRITFSGNTTIPDEVIRREILVIEGYVINTSMLEVSLLRLNRLGLFEEIRLEDASIKPVGDQRKIDIELKLREK